MDPGQLMMMRFEYKKAIIQAVIDPTVDLTKLTQDEELFNRVMQTISVFSTQLLSDDMGFFQSRLNVAEQQLINKVEQEGEEGSSVSDGSG
jgi:hypothetical protein